MAERYRFTSTKNPATDYTEEVVLERDDNGNITKTLKRNGPSVSLTKDQFASLSSTLNLEVVSADEVKKEKEQGPVQPQQQPGDDIAAQAPRVGQGIGGNVNSPVDAVGAGPSGGATV